ncbi:ThuA domain-containing protein [Chloroflexota bacterium]|nr:ThuA domain-containing protein [Chloroflexota bacterium]
MDNKPKVTVWNEFRHERADPVVLAIYPEGIHGAIAGFLRTGGFQVRTATLDEPEHGLTQEVLDDTDVLIWWGHMAHGEVQDAIVDRVQERVLNGMGLIVLHSGHFSKIFKRMMGTSCNLRWREAAEKERIWTIANGHPITKGVGLHFELPHTEMYGEYFDIPEPDVLVFVSWFAGGDVFRSGCCWQRGFGRVFYFAPGHETFPIYYDKNIQQVITNACLWAADHKQHTVEFGHVPEPLEPLD